MSSLSKLGACSVVVGIVIGAGIFKTPSMVAGITQDLGWLIAVWLLGALLSFAGALCWAELSSSHPSTGGEYHFLDKAYGPSLAFLYAWAKTVVINPGAIALLGFVLGDYLSAIYSLPWHSSAVWAMAVILLLTATNLVGLKASAQLQTGMLVVELLVLLAIVVAGFSVGSPAAVDSATSQAASSGLFATSPPLGLLGLAMVFVLLTFGGWGESAYLSAELRDGPRAIMKVLLISLSVISGIYILVNLALVAGLGIGGLANSKAPGADILTMAFGSGNAQWAVAILSLAVGLAALTSINATMIVGARTTHALGNTWPALRLLSRWNPSKGLPVAALLFQSGIALALVAFGAMQKDGFTAMVEFTAPVFWGFLCLVGVSLFVLRRKAPAHNDAFRVPLYPITPILFVASCGYLTYSSVQYAMSQQALTVSAWLMVVGVLVLLALRFGSGNTGATRPA